MCKKVNRTVNYSFLQNKKPEQAWESACCRLKTKKDIFDTTQCILVAKEIRLILENIKQRFELLALLFNMNKHVQVSSVSQEWQVHPY